MPRKDFAAFTRLDASDVNTFLMDQAVQTFAGTAARGSAITTPVEGMVTYLEDLDRYDTYNGSSHVPMGGLTYIKTVTDTSVAAINVTDVFSSTYQNYVVFINWEHSSSTTSNLRLRTSSDDTDANYGSSTLEVNLIGTVATSGTGTTSTSFQLEPTTRASGAAKLDFYDPNLAKNTRFTMIRDRPGAAIAGGLLNTTIQYTGFTFFPSSGTTTATIRVYGVRD
jgi:hypothetical protein